MTDYQQAILAGSEAGGGGQGASVPPTAPTQPFSGKNGHVDDARELVPSRPDVSARPGAPRVGRRENWIEIPDPTYQGFQFRVWVNYPQKYEDMLRSGDEEKMHAALTTIILEHNGWLDEEGAPYPPANDAEFYKQIPTELLAVMLTLVRQESARLSNLLMQNWRNTKNT